MRIFIQAIVVIMILSITTACSNKVVLPPKPVFKGDCPSDLDNLMRWYVMPIEKQRR